MLASGILDSRLLYLPQWCMDRHAYAKTEGNKCGLMRYSYVCNVVTLSL